MSPFQSLREARMRWAASGQLTIDPRREAEGEREAENAQLRREIERLRRENARLSDEVGYRDGELRRLKEHARVRAAQQPRRRTAAL